MSDTIPYTPLFISTGFTILVTFSRFLELSIKGQQLTPVNYRHNARIDDQYRFDIYLLKKEL